MEPTIEQVEDVVVVTLPGTHLDASNHKECTQSIVGLLESNSKVLFDLSELQFVDSSGIGSILFCMRKANDAGGKLRICNVTEPVRVVFDLVRMHRIIDVHANREEALEAFKNQG